jgi:branched-chain amino acid transport system ATP-binding protein
LGPSEKEVTRPATPAKRVQPLLEGRGIGKSFGGLVALTGVDLVINAGDMVGLIGPNGSGKTTLFNCLTGMEKLTEGRVFFNGEDITARKPFEMARLGLSRTFQSIRVYRRLTLMENMLLSQQWRERSWLDVLRPGRPTTTGRAEELLHFVTLHRQRAQLAGELSWGQQRLLEIAMALMCDPQLILLDEATSGVNPALVDTISDRIATLNAGLGKTVVLIEHNTDLIASLCRRVVVLDHGRKLAEGEVGAVFDDPRVVAAYLGNEGVDV